MKSKEQVGFDIISVGKEGLIRPLIIRFVIYVLWKVYLLSAKIPKKRGWEGNYGNSILRLSYKVLVGRMR